MKRRDFLRYSIAVGLANSSLYALANTMSHAGHSGHGGMMSTFGKATDLMPLNAMPSGKPLLSTLPKLANLSSQAGVFKAKLTAAPVKLRIAGENDTEFWAYNGQLPGPQIEVFEGDTLEIEFTNNLPQPTTIHWHGLDVPEDADGNPHNPVEPNAQKIYRFTLPKGSAGTYWYHPHPHGYVAEQVYKGLAGTLVVKAKDDPLASLNEQHWVISDLRLASDSTIPPNKPLDWLNGREGEFVLINGQYQPKMQVQTNERIRIWNATSARYFRLKIEGVKWIVVGTDGGLLTEPRPAVDELFLAPAERVEVIMVGETQGEVNLQSLYYDRRKMMIKEDRSDLTLGTIQVKTAEVVQLPTQLRALPLFGEPVVRRQISFSEAMMNYHQSGGSGSSGGGASQHQMHEGAKGHTMPNDVPTDNPIPTKMVGAFLVNDKVFDMNRTDFISKRNTVEEWEVFNNSHMDHPFHLHGTQFEILQHTVNGKTSTAPYRALKDTVNLRPYETIVIRFKQGHTGLKMYHCHILEHENLGMMAMFRVIDE